MLVSINSVSRSRVLLTGSLLTTTLICLKPSVIHQVRPHYGQGRVAHRLRSLLHSSVYPSEIAGKSEGAGVGQLFVMCFVTKKEYCQEIYVNIECV